MTAPASCIVCDAPMGEQHADRRGDLVETPICGPQCRMVWYGRIASRVDHLGGTA